MKNYSIVRFTDSVNNMLSGPAVSNYDFLNAMNDYRLMKNAHMVTYKQRRYGLRYPEKLKIWEVELKEDKNVLSRMPLQPHFHTLDKALNFTDNLKKNVLSIAVSGRYGPQALQFSNLVNKNSKKKAYAIIEGHGSDVCGYQLRQFETLYKSCYKAADLVLLMETPIAKYYFKKEGFPVENMAVIPTVIYWEKIIERIKKNKEIIQNVRRKYERLYKIPSDSDLILTIGRLQPEKGHKYLVKAARYVLEENPNTYFMLSGGKDVTKKEIISLIKKINPKRIKLVPVIPFKEFYPLIASSMAFVIPSIEVWKNKKLFFAETGPRTVVDAMASSLVGRCAVIASRSGGTPWKFNMDKWLKISMKKSSYVPELPCYKKLTGKKEGYVENANNRGLLFEQANPKSIAEAINLVIGDSGLRKKLIKGQRNYVREWYSSKTILQNYLKLVETLV